MGRRWGIIPTRGVYQGLAFSGALTSGSSPLARGLHDDEQHRRLGLRIIPARAGFTEMRIMVEFQSPDHPRSRGVYGRIKSPSRVCLGSSPLARGLPSSLPPPKTPIADHPRSRGVYTSALVALFRLFGSSPLARGLPAHCAPYAQDDGIIPARAGFTAADRRRHHRPGDHPRSRGVYHWRSREHVRDAGSSPLARGLRIAKQEIVTAVRIIPARAGFTASGASASASASDHPRSRGVYTCGSLESQR